MSGCEQNIIWNIKVENKRADCYQYDIEFDRIYETKNANFFEGGWCFWGLPEWEKKLTENDQLYDNNEHIDFKKLFKILKKYDENNFVIGASRTKPTDEQWGIIGGHAYSVISLIEYESRGIQLVQLRNPWGQ